MRIAKTLRGQTVLVLAAVGLWVLGLTCWAAAAEFKMGVIDPQAVLEKSKAGKKALDGLKEYVSTRQKLLSRDEEELRNTEKTLKEAGAKLSEGEKKRRKRSFAARFKTIRNEHRSLIRNCRVNRKSS